MLWLDVKVGGSVRIGDDISVTVTRIIKDHGASPLVRIGIDAPESVLIMREELLSKKTS